MLLTWDRYVKYVALLNMYIMRVPNLGQWYNSTTRLRKYMFMDWDLGILCF